MFKGKGEDKELVDGKYHWLYAHDVGATRWKKVKIEKPHYLFIPKNISGRKEYEQYVKITDVFPVNSTGIVTSRDDFVIDFEMDPLLIRMDDFADKRINDEEIKEKYRLAENYAWRVESARKDIRNIKIDKSHVKRILYRPFDLRNIFFHPSVVWRTREQVMRHMVDGKNVGLIATRQTRDKWDVLCTATLMGHKSLAAYDINSLFPLYLYEGVKKGKKDKGFATTLLLFEPEREYHGKRPNLDEKFIKEFSEKLGLSFIMDGRGDLKRTFGPEDVFHYIYAVFHSPEYRMRYAEFLKIDFPRVPLTANVKLFRLLCALGSELTALHLLEETPKPFTAFPEKGSNEIEIVRHDEEKRGMVWINKTQYFENVPTDVWEFQVGGYQVMQKWLKDRKGRSLTYDDIKHYCVIAATLKETVRLMAEVDGAISKQGGWPIG